MSMSTVANNPDMMPLYYNASDRSIATPGRFSVETLTQAGTVTPLNDVTVLAAGGSYTLQGSGAGYGCKTIINGMTALPGDTSVSLVGSSRFVLAASGPAMYVSGGTGILRFDTATNKFGAAFTGSVNTSGTINAMACVGPRLYVGGNFTGAFGLTACQNLVAYDSASGAWFKPLAAGPNGAVYTMAATGTSLFLGGAFTSIAGGATGYLARINTSTNTMQQAFTGPSRVQFTGPGIASPTVYAIATTGPAVYVGGNFGLFGSYYSLFRITGSGASDYIGDRFTGSTDTVYAIQPVDPWRAYVGGSFTGSYNGGTVFNSKNLQRVNLAFGDAPQTFGADVQQPVRSLALDPVSGNVYFAGSFTGVGSTGWARLAAVDGSLPNVPGSSGTYRGVCAPMGPGYSGAASDTYSPQLLTVGSAVYACSKYGLDGSPTLPQVVRVTPYTNTYTSVKGNYLNPGALMPLILTATLPAGAQMDAVCVNGTWIASTSDPRVTIA